MLFIGPFIEMVESVYSSALRRFFGGLEPNIDVHKISLMMIYLAKPFIELKHCFSNAGSVVFRFVI